MQPVSCESVARLGMLQHTAAPPHRRKRGRKAPAIVAKLAACLGARSARPIATPTLARRVGHYGIGAVVQARVTRLVPRINLRQTKVDPIGHYEKCSDATHWELTG